MTYSEIIKKYLRADIKPERSTNLILFEVRSDSLAQMCQQLYKNYKLPLKIIKAADERSENGSFKIFYIFGIPGEDFFLAPYLVLNNTTEFPSLTPYIHEASYYELEIYNFFGLTPSGHPHLSQFILHENWPKNEFPLRKDFSWKKRPADAKNKQQQFEVVAGEGIYEIPVGPVHAGIIEPGHFRFSVAGEEIVNLEPKLGYVHKGSEKLFEILPPADKVRLSERISGDTSFSQSLTYCQAVENLSGIKVPQRAKYLRVIFSELERLANHFNDIGFIINDTAFAFGGSNGPRLREEIMQLCDSLTGSRFLRGINTVGGVSKDLPDEMIKMIEEKLRKVRKDFEEVIDIIDDNQSVQNRLKGTGVLDKQIGIDHGVVGIAARALGLPKDSRVEYAYAAYKDMPVKIAHQITGDVFARFHVRVAESINSIEIILHALKKLPKGSIKDSSQVDLQKGAYTVSITEGWRGDIVYLVATNKTGDISRVGVRDASFLNWPAVPYAVVGNIVPDFPLINKSFNLSYSGFDR